MSQAALTPIVPWSAADIGDQRGRTFLVTGANSGLGFATTRELARRGAHVIMAVRDLDKGAAARGELESALERPSLELRRLDLLELGSVRSLAKDLLDERRPIDVLVNNAGFGGGPHQVSPEGMESTLAANHLGHFALTGLLFDRIAESQDPRVVTVTSGFIRLGTPRIPFDNLDGKRGWSAGRAYVESKLANALFGLELSRRLRAAGSRVKSVLAHPGFSATPMQQKATGVVGVIARVMSALFALPTEVGVLGQLYAATADGVEGGELIGPGKRDGRGRPSVEPTGKPAMDLDAARRLWEVSERLSGVRFSASIGA